MQVEDGGEFATTRSQSEPAVMTSVRKLLPVFLGEFEQDDVIRRIEDANLDGQSARCIMFQTLKRRPRNSRTRLRGCRPRLACGSDPG